MKIVRSRSFWVALVTALLAVAAMIVFCVMVMADEAAVIERRKSEMVFFAVMLALTALGTGGYAVSKYIMYRKKGGSDNG